MKPLTPKQREVLEWIEFKQRQGETPSLREIAGHFGFRSMTAAADHVRALRRKGRLRGEAHRARALQVVPPLARVKAAVAEIPLFGEIPAGFADEREQETKGCVALDVKTLGIKPTPRTFALEVRGDSMIGKHILEGDIVVLEHGMNPRPGDVVAALIDNESTLKTFVVERGKPCLRAENPRYPKLIPARELVIQGVMIALIRRAKR